LVGLTLAESPVRTPPVTALSAFVAEACVNMIAATRFLYTVPKSPGQGTERFPPPSELEVYADAVEIDG
jgi:hypothetical protein